MTMASKTTFQIEGTIYAKPSRKIISKKDGKEYEFNSIILEIRRTHKDKVYTELPEFHFGYGVTDNGFDVGDNVQITFSLAGKKVRDDFHKTELKALYIKHPDLQQGSDTTDVSGDDFWKKKKEPLPVPEDDDQSDLPF